jgi:tagaturonate epimerase
MSLADVAQVRPASLAVEDGLVCGLADTARGPALVVGGDARGFEGERDGSLLVGPLSGHNAAALRARFEWLRPRPLGIQPSFGLGDRLGLATPGHVRALRATGTRLAPVLAQQSIRELDRTGRTPREVLDAATWGAFAEGWRAGFGADADHLKTPADIERFAAAGYTLFTVDPSDHVPGGRGSPEAVRRYAGMSIDLGDRELTLSERDVAGAARKYGAAIEHVAALAAHIPAGGELEVSVDETETPTTPVEHVFIACELRRRGVRWVSLAPRFAGRFEKGIDYIGDVERFAADFAVHAAIAQRLGPYKLSLHSGSDKFSLYPAIAGARVHVKTSGTSYLEALRTVAAHDPDLFRRLYALALERFEADRASYHVSVGRPPPPAAATLDDDDVRRVLHVTFGSVLADGALVARVRDLHEEYAAALERHVARHLRPFA